MLRRLRCGQRGVECALRRREVRSASQVLPSPPVPRPANRRAPRGLDARQIVLLLILPSDTSSVRTLLTCFIWVCPKALLGWMCGGGWSALKRVNRCDHHLLLRPPLLLHCRCCYASDPQSFSFSIQLQPGIWPHLSAQAWPNVVRFVNPSQAK